MIDRHQPIRGAPCATPPHPPLHVLPRSAGGGSFSSIDAALGAVAIARTQAATKDLPMIVRVRDGVCEILAPLQITSAHTGTSPTAPTVLVGDSASSVISGGGAIPDWRPVDWPGAPTGRVVAASISAWPVQVKSLRVGSRVVPPARWPHKVGDGSTTPNWLFASSWSNPGAPSDNRHPVQLGLNPAAFPLGTNFSSLVNAYAHVFGCIEKDVNSQLTRIESVSLLPGTVSVSCRGLTAQCLSTIIHSRVFPRIPCNPAVSPTVAHASYADCSTLCDTHVSELVYGEPTILPRECSLGAVAGIILCERRRAGEIAADWQSWL